jgi:hypothetical protein
MKRQLSEATRLKKAARERRWREVHKGDMRIEAIWSDSGYDEPVPKAVVWRWGLGVYLVSPPADCKTCPEYVVTEIVRSQPGFHFMLGNRYARNGADIRLRHTGTRRLWRVSWRAPEGWVESRAARGRNSALRHGLHNWLKAWE